jgi:hypothetical protein
VKFLYVILSLYLVLLSSLPCADVEVNTSAYTEMASTSNQDEHSHDKEDDLCSPFCICNCCGSQITHYLQVVMIDFPILSKPIKTQLPTYKFLFASNFYGSIWQPPQIV